jgi:hypothetical protein
MADDPAVGHQSFAAVGTPGEMTMQLAQYFDGSLPNFGCGRFRRPREQYPEFLSIDMFLRRSRQPKAPQSC